MTRGQRKLLIKWVSQYCDPTVPQEVVDEKVNELIDLYKQNKFIFNEEKVYENMRGIVRVKNPTDCIAEMEAEMDDNSGDESYSLMEEL